MVDRVIHKFVLWFSDNPFYQFFLKYKKLIVAVLITAILALSKEMILLNEEAMLLRAYLPWIYVYERIAYTLAAILFMLFSINVYLSGIYSDLSGILDRRVEDVVYQGKTFIVIQGWGNVTVDRHLPEVRSLGGNFRWNFYCEKTNTIDGYKPFGAILNISESTNFFVDLGQNNCRVIDVADFYVCQGSDGISSPQFCGQLSLYEDDDGKRTLMGYGQDIDRTHVDVLVRFIR